jgi:hypothetical protein
MLVASLIAVILLVGLVLLSAGGRGRFRIAAGIAMVGLVLATFGFFVPVIFPPALFTALLLTVVGMVCASRGANVKQFRRWAVIAGIAGMGLGFAISWPYVSSLRRMARQYPFESMSARLAYETRIPGRVADAKPRFAPPPAESPAWPRLTQVEQSLPFRPYSRREQALERVHASVMQQFMDAPGFGVGRMSYLDESSLASRLKDPPPAFAAAPDTVSPRAPTGPLDRLGPFLGQGDDEKSLPSQLWGLHLYGVGDFASPAGTGLFVDRQHVAGFEPHGFAREFREYMYIHPGDRGLSLEQLELVSLLKHETPRVYISDGRFPRMDRLSQAETRSPNGFEAASIELLDKGEDLVWSEQSGRLAVLGAIRAAKTCVECHYVERGTLLGAFSYQFSIESHAPPLQRPDGRTF